jgi:hypothetical protein
MGKLGRKSGFLSEERDKRALAERMIADEVARKIREVKELCRRRRAASRKGAGEEL